MKNLLTAFIALFFVASTNGQPPIYKITGNGLESPSYIYGTMHLINKSDFSLPSNMKKTIKSCETVVFEIDPNTMKEQAKKNGMSMILPEGTTYNDLMSKERMKWLNSYMSDTLGISDLMQGIYLKMKPMYLSSFLLKKGLKKTKSYEEAIHKMARKKNEVGLETVAEQLAFLDDIPLQVQADMIEPGGIETFNEMSAVYKQGDLDKLMEWSKESIDGSEYKTLEQAIINNRNENWIPKLEKLMKAGSTFTAVGALHLPGEKGVLQLLREAGYTVVKM